jgi:aspartyl-tRNA(Asn)/glutamyl-tRNA(Gln) amidotransferase subunit B
MAQDTLRKMLESGKSTSAYIGDEDLGGVSDDALEKLCTEAIEANPRAVADIKAGKDKAMNVMFGYIMKQTKGKADAQKAEPIIRALIARMP